MAVCGICRKPIGYVEDTRCLRCGNPFHECIRTAPGSGETALADRGWICIACRAAPNLSCSSSASSVSDHQPHVPTDRALERATGDNSSPALETPLLPSLQDAASASFTALNTSHFEIIMNQFSKLNASVNECNNKITETQEMFAHHGQLISDCREDITTLKKENVQLHRKVTTLERILDVMKPQKIFREFKERQARECNIMIWGLPETGSEGADAGAVAEVLGMVTDIPDRGIITVSRVGKSQESSPRMIRVSLCSVRLRNAVLRSKARLIHSGYKSVYIRPDLTVQQSDMLKDIQGELRERKANGEVNLIVYRDGDLALVTQHPSKAHNAHTSRNQVTQLNNLPSSSPAQHLDLDLGTEGSESGHFLAGARAPSQAFSGPSGIARPTQSNADTPSDKPKQSREEDVSPKRTQGVKVPNQSTVK